LRSLGYSKRTRNFRNAIARLLASGLLEMTIPGKPRSKKQRYRITERGKQFLKEHDTH
jgi:ATP-dependent DNA helicase RecG